MICEDGWSMSFNLLKTILNGNLPLQLYLNSMLFTNYQHNILILDIIWRSRHKIHSLLKERQQKNARLSFLGDKIQY
jgi:hypothetical protein